MKSALPFATELLNALKSYIDDTGNKNRKQAAKILCQRIVNTLGEDLGVANEDIATEIKTAQLELLVENFIDSDLMLRGSIMHHESHLVTPLRMLLQKFKPPLTQNHEEKETSQTKEETERQFLKAVQAHLPNGELPSVAFRQHSIQTELIYSKGKTYLAKQIEKPDSNEILYGDIMRCILGPSQPQYQHMTREDEYTDKNGIQRVAKVYLNASEVRLHCKALSVKQYTNRNKHPRGFTATILMAYLLGEQDLKQANLLVTPEGEIVNIDHGRKSLLNPAANTAIVIPGGCYNESGIHVPSLDTSGTNNLPNLVNESTPWGKTTPGVTWLSQCGYKYHGNTACAKKAYRHIEDTRAVLQQIEDRLPDIEKMIENRQCTTDEHERLKTSFRWRFNQIKNQFNKQHPHKPNATSRPESKSDSSSLMMQASQQLRSHNKNQSLHKSFSCNKAQAQRDRKRDLTKTIENLTQASNSSDMQAEFQLFYILDCYHSTNPEILEATGLEDIYKQLSHRAGFKQRYYTYFNTHHATLQNSLVRAIAQQYTLDKHLNSPLHFLFDWTSSRRSRQFVKFVTSNEATDKLDTAQAAEDIYGIVDHSYKRSRLRERLSPAYKYHDHLRKALENLPTLNKDEESQSEEIEQKQFPQPRR